MPAIRRNSRPCWPLLFLFVVSLAGAQSGPVPPADPADPAPVADKALPVRDPTLYRARVSLTTQSASERQAATGRALAQVLVKLTGDVDAPTNAVVRKAMANASALVADTQAAAAPEDAEGNTAVGGDEIFKTNLDLAFDPVAVDALIASAGLKYWSGGRPRPVLWLAIDDGRGPRLVNAQQTNVVRSLAERASARGLTLLLPAGTPVEQAAVARLWALDPTALVPLTARYNNDTFLMGKMYRSVSGWSCWWILVQAGAEVARWPMTDADPRKVIASGADPAADAFARRDAVFLDIGPAGKYAIDVVGVQTRDDYLRVLAYVQSLPVVRRVDVVEAAPDHLRLMLDLGVGLKGFRALVASDDTLQPPEDADTAQATPAPVPRYLLR